MDRVWTRGRAVMIAVIQQKESKQQSSVGRTCYTDRILMDNVRKNRRKKNSHERPKHEIMNRRPLDFAI